MHYRVNLYESKFSKVKSYSTFNKNRINVPFSVANSSAYMRAAEIIQHKHHRDVFLCDNGNVVKVGKIQGYNAIIGNFVF